jgi:hypothetical protein
MVQLGFLRVEPQLAPRICGVALSLPLGLRCRFTRFASGPLDELGTGRNGVCRIVIIVKRTHHV